MPRPRCLPGRHPCACVCIYSVSFAARYTHTAQRQPNVEFRLKLPWKRTAELEELRCAVYFALSGCSEPDDSPSQEREPGSHLWNPPPPPASADTVQATGALLHSEFHFHIHIAYWFHTRFFICPLSCRTEELVVRRR